MAKDQRIETLNAEIDALKREYDLYLAGQRRTEPLMMHQELGRKVLLLTRDPTTSTVFKFRVKTLANRFRSLETQLKNLMDRKNSRHAGAEQPKARKPSAVIIDEMAINNPALVVARVRKMVAELEKKNNGNDNAISINPENFCNALVGKARAMVGKNEVRAVRFHIVENENGRKVKGETITAPK